ncbi:type II and III secretion system protein family protein [Chitinimonas sp.]|uniref:type II and III secretion system protein family protein n=1 Tax=Chitinimonas sp. TaxID=1934313 RepID=UPI0035B3913F
MLLMIGSVAWADEIRMFVGELKTLPVGKVDRVAIGNGNVISSKVLDSGELLLLAEKPGDTSLMVWSGKSRQQHMVRVSQTDSQEAFRVASAMLKDVPGISLGQVAGNVVVTGSTSKENLERISMLGKLYPQIANLARPEDVAMKKMVYIKVQILEMKRSLLEHIGVQWPNSFDGPKLGLLGNFGATSTQGLYKPSATPGAPPEPIAPIGGVLPVQTGNRGLRAYLGINSLINTTINLAKNNGDAYVLAEPELSTRSGGEAKFLAGGQIPLPAVSSTGAGSVEFKDYGIRLTIRPLADDRDNVLANVKTEISSVDSSVSVQGIPGFLTRQTETDINVKNGQTIVMSGLVNSDLSKDISRVPGLGSVPIIGALFRSDNFKSGRTDLVILVTPTVVDPNSTINRERIDKSESIRERFERGISKTDLLD